MYSGIFHNYYVSISFSMLTATLYTDTMTHHCVPDPTEQGSQVCGKIPISVFVPFSAFTCAHSNQPNAMFINLEITVYYILYTKPDVFKKVL